MKTKTEKHLSTCASNRIANRGEDPRLTCDCLSAGDNWPVLEKISSDYYKNTKPYSGKKADGALREAWRDEEIFLRNLFKHDCEKEFGILGHDRADKLFEIAWSHGHSSGYSEVFCFYQEFVDLVK